MDIQRLERVIRNLKDKSVVYEKNNKKIKGLEDELRDLQDQINSLNDRISILEKTE